MSMLLNRVQTVARNGAIVAGLLSLGSPVLAEDLTARVVMTKMGPDERAGFIAGVVEGLAYARFAKEGDEQPGMRCIYEWFYRGENSLKKIHAAFDYFPDHLPGAVIAALIEQECGP